MSNFDYVLGIVCYHASISKKKKYPNGERYVEEWLSSNRKGEVTFIKSNGNKFTGKCDTYHGKSSLICADENHYEYIGR